MMLTSSPCTTAIRLVGLVKSFGTVRAVQSVDISVSRGETVALLGPNGAGKSTTIDMMLGLSRPDQGHVELFGLAPADAVKAGSVGVMLQMGALIRDLSVRELITMMASLYREPLDVDEVLDRADLRTACRPAHTEAVGWGDAAGPLRHRAGVGPRPPGARRADRRPRRRSPARLLDDDARLRRPRQDGHLCHPLPRGGRRLRRSCRAHGTGASDRRRLPHGDQSESRRAHHPGDAPRCRPRRPERSARRGGGRPPRRRASSCTARTPTRPCERCSPPTPTFTTSRSAVLRWKTPSWSSPPPTSIHPWRCHDERRGLHPLRSAAHRTQRPVFHHLVGVPTRSFFSSSQDRTATSSSTAFRSPPITWSGMISWGAMGPSSPPVLASPVNAPSDGTVSFASHHCQYAPTSRPRCSRAT